jgi:hypothetical protein
MKDRGILNEVSEEHVTAIIRVEDAKQETSTNQEES